MTGDTNTPCTAHRAVELAFDELSWRTGGRLTRAEIVAYAAQRANRSPAEVDRVIARRVRLGKLVYASPDVLERVFLPVTVRELRARMEKP